MRALLFVMAILGAGLVGAVAGRALYPPPPPPAAAPSALDARMETLETRVTRLAEEVRALGAPAAAAPPPAPSPAAGLPEPPPVGPALVPAADLEERVRATVEEIAREEREARERRAEQEQLAREEAWLAKVAADLGLTESQRTLLADMLVRRREYIAGYRARLAERGDALTTEERSALAREAEDYGKQLDTELRAALSPEQYEAIMRMRNPSNRSPGDR